MPAHDYICESCYYAWEDNVSCEEHERIKKGKCPKCDKKTVVVAFRSAPAIRTSATWSRGHGTLLDQFGDTEQGRAQLASRVAQAEAEGYTPRPNDIYMPGVAAHPGDRDGFVPSDDPEGHLKRVAAKRGVACHDPIAKVAGPGPQEVKPEPLAMDIVENLAAEKIRANPDLGRKTKAEITEMIRDEHSYTG